MADKVEQTFVKGQRRTRCARSSPRKGKQQKVFVRLTETVSRDADLKAFLLHRMAPKVVPFNIIETPAAKDPDRGNGTARVVLLFESRALASKAVYLLHRSNQNTTAKIYCFFTSEERDQQQIQSRGQRENRLKQHLQEIFEAARSSLDRHDKKILEAKEELTKIEETLRANRGLSLEAFENFRSEKGAREDKVQEMESQRKEYQFFLTNFKDRFEGLRSDSNYEAKINELRKYFGVECNRLKCALPMYARRSDILDIVQKNQVSVILGETGSGKSTQMAQYLFQAGFAGEGMIACTQPRKIAAISLATHVAKEMASSVGQVVGYRVGMQIKKTAVTKVLYMTDHVLLNECLKDNSLAEYSCLIIDEAHERSIYTDLLLGMIKACLKRRPDLKVIVTSATINPDVFVSFFGGPDVCPVLRVSGRTFPVSVLYADDDEEQPFPENYEEKAVKKAVQIHTEMPVIDGDILVFLTSPLEIEKCTEMFQQTVSGKTHKCLQLHGKLQAEEQKAVFDPLPPGIRKIVFATNSAETSVTIPGIKFVIDSGLAKEMRYDPKKNMNSLSIYPISKSSAEQRKGRAGRMAPGTCYRLYTDKNFSEMETSTKPEILRVHLGQALLKLLELGVNPLQFDFVESPPRDTLEIAMNTLQDIEAVEEGSITDLGRWIAKLPIEPRLGVLVKNGIIKGVPIEGMVVAACCNTGGIFYRSGTEAEKRTADIKKTQFCHPGGDLLTMLNVFRDWHQVNEKGKGKWCRDNSINGKAMKGVRETINEILTVLRKEMKEDIKFVLNPREDCERIVQGLAIQCMKNNVCCFLGHEQAGYITAVQLQHVQIHPSSSLKSLGQTPAWLVYWQLLQTSRTFITNLTPVDEELLKSLDMNVSFEVNEEELQNQRVKLAGKIPVGGFVFRKFVGPMHKHRRDKEEEMKQLYEHSIVIIEADRNVGEIQLFCNQRFAENAFTDLKKVIQGVAEPLQLETTEIHLGKAERGSTRAVLGAGGSVQDILMPHQFRTLKIKLEDSDCIDEADLRTYLASFGDIVELIQFRRKGKSNNEFWGKATFVRKEDAVKAVEGVKKRPEGDLTLVPERYGGDGKRNTCFTLKLTWTRRSSKGFGYVDLNRPEDMASLLTRGTMLVGSTIVSITRAKRGNIYLKGLGLNVVEEDVVKALSDVVGVEPDNKRFKVIIPRTDVVDTARDPQMVIKETLQHFVPEDSFKIKLKEMKPSTVKGGAFVTFTNPDHFHTAANDLIERSPLYLNGSKVDVVIDLKSSLHIPKRLYEVTRQDIEEYRAEVANNMQNVSVIVRRIQSGNCIIDIKASSTRDMASAQVGIHKVIDGECLECEKNKEITKLFTRDAREYLRKIEQEVKSLVLVDDRTMTVRIQGSSESKTRTRIKINEYLSKMENSSEKQLTLKGPNHPVGLMKTLMMKYNIDLSRLQKECGLLSVVLMHRFHSVCLTGETSSIEKASAIIEQVKNELHATNRSVKGEEEPLPACPICLCDIEQPELVRLEYCGHPYCHPCLQSQVQSAVNEKQFPLVCAVEDCNKLFVYKDIHLLVQKGILKMKSLGKASVSDFVGKNQKAFRYCITPDCDMVYCVSGDGQKFQCSDCDAMVCTTCHIQYHDGLTCAMYNSAKSGEGSVDLWVREKPDCRKKCPKCQVGIEKIEGCNHMTCLACRAHICWVCLAYFSSSDGCYGHLQTAHGSFM